MKKMFRPNTEMVNYLGRVVPRKYFRVFIYNEYGEKKLVNSWDEYKKLIGTAEWFAEKPPQKRRKRQKKPE